GLLARTRFHRASGRSGPAVRRRRRPVGPQRSSLQETVTAHQIPTGLCRTRSRLCNDHTPSQRSRDVRVRWGVSKKLPPQSSANESHLRWRVSTTAKLLQDARCQEIARPPRCSQQPLPPATESQNPIVPTGKTNAVATAGSATYRAPSLARKGRRCKSPSVSPTEFPGASTSAEPKLIQPNSQ